MLFKEKKSIFLSFRCFQIGNSNKPSELLDFSMTKFSVWYVKQEWWSKDWSKTARQSIFNWLVIAQISVEQPPHSFSEGKCNYVSKKSSVKFVGLVNAQISVKQPPQSFLGTSVIAGHLSLVTLSHKHLHQLVPIPTHPLVESAWLWGLWVKRTGSSSTSISSDLAWIHISIAIGAARGLLSFRLTSGVTCLSDLHRPIMD